MHDRMCGGERSNDNQWTDMRGGCFGGGDSATGLINSDLVVMNVCVNIGVGVNEM